LLFSENNLKRFFELIDEDKKGYLNSKDIQFFSFQYKMVNEEAIKEYLKQFGMKIDDKLYFDDFAYIMQNNCSLDKNENDKNLKKDNQLNFDQGNIYEDEKESNEEND
jgi:hypothetical protein